MPPQPPSIRIALTTVGSLEEGRRLARTLVESRLAACVNLIPHLSSIYRWQGTVEEAGEILLLMKTTTEMLPALEATIRVIHPYEVPEFLALEVDSGSSPYMSWLLESVGNQ